MATAPTKRDPLEPLLIALQERIGATEQGMQDIEAALRAAVRAVLPGRQQKKNLTPALDMARKAFVRSLRRRARA